MPFKWRPKFWTKFRDVEKKLIRLGISFGCWAGAVLTVINLSYHAMRYSFIEGMVRGSVTIGMVYVLVLGLLGYIVSAGIPKLDFMKLARAVMNQDPEPGSVPGPAAAGGFGAFIPPPRIPPPDNPAPGYRPPDPNRPQGQ